MVEPRPLSFLGIDVASKLGACWKCMTLSAMLMVVSGVLLMVAARTAPGGVVLLTSLPFGFFVGLTGSHAAAFVLRRVSREQAPPDPAPDARPCCGGAKAS